MKGLSKEVKSAIIIGIVIVLLLILGIIYGQKEKTEVADTPTTTVSEVAESTTAAAAESTTAAPETTTSANVTVPAGAWVGWAVSCLGDTNGDGIDDFVLGAGTRGYQQATVIFGARDFSPVDLDFLGTRGFVIEDPGAADKTTADNSTDNFGYSVAAVGDIDGDGLDDIAVGDILADYNGRTNSGRVWIVKGQTSVRTVNVQTDAGRVIRTIDGAAAQDRLGTVSSAGDVNGDGTVNNKDRLILTRYLAKWTGYETLPYKQ